MGETPEIKWHDPKQVDIKAQAAAAKREITMRRRVYPRWVASGRMTADAAGREIAAMEAILLTLERTDTAERLL